jgi:hypothetical protein
MAVSWRVGFRTGAPALVAVSPVVSLGGCGGSSSTPTPVPTPTPTPPPVARVVMEGSEHGLEALTLLWVPFMTSATGALDATVDWTSASNDVDVYLAKGTDPCNLNNPDCGGER